MPTSMTPTTNLTNDMYKKDGEMKTKASNFYHKRETNDTRSAKSSSGRNRDRETHHRYSYDLSSSSAKTTFHNTANGNNRPTIASKQSSNKSNAHKNRPLSPNLASNKESKYVDYENLLKQFEKLKLKAELFADKDPEFAAKLINLANKITKSAPKMDSSFYPNGYYPRSSAYSTHSNYPSSNIYSTFNSSNFSHPNHSFPSPHHHSPPSNPPPPPPPTPPRPPPIPTNSYRNSTSTHYPSDTSNNFFTNANFSSFSYDTSQYSNNPHFTRQSTTKPAQTSSFDHNVYTQYFNYSYPNTDNSFKYSYSFAHDRPEDLLLILEDPYDSNKITVQMTRTQVGPDGEQQRVTIERDFKSELELNKFLKEFEDNLNKTTSSSIPSQTKSPSFSNFFCHQPKDNDDDYKPGVVVIEEPGEEPILYRQDTGELLSNGSFKDPLKKEQNNEHPNEVPKKREDQVPKFYKDIDDLFKCEEAQSDDSLPKAMDAEKFSVSTSSQSQNDTTSRDLINFDDDISMEPKSEPKIPKPEQIRRTVRRAESFVMPKAQADTKTSVKKDPNPKIHFRSSSTSIRKPQVAEPSEKPPIKPEVIKKQINTEPPRPAHLSEKSKIKVLNINKSGKQNGSLGENLNNVQSNKPLRPEIPKKESSQGEKIKPSSQFKHQYDKPLLSSHAKLGGEPAVSLKRHTSLLCQKTSLLEKKFSDEKKSLNIPVSEAEPKLKKCEIKSRFSLRETRPNIKDNSRRYSQIYHKESDSDISTIHEERKDEEFYSEANEKMMDEKKQKFIKNHRLMMSKKLSKSVDTGLSERGSKYMKINKIEGKINQKNRSKLGSEHSLRQDYISDSDEYEAGNAVYGDESFRSSNNQLNYDFYSYDQTYSDGYYNFFNTAQSPAYFQPGFFERPKSTIHEQDISPQVSAASQPTQTQNSQAHAHYYPSYYTSWYGSAPSLRIQTQRVDNCQSIYFN